jgi:hypothetical protein
MLLEKPVTGSDLLTAIKAVTFTHIALNVLRLTNRIALSMAISISAQQWNRQRSC